jgi:hypothetical protein
MSAAQQSQPPRQYTGIYSFVIDVSDHNDPFIAPRPSLTIYQAWDTNVTHHDTQSAHDALAAFGPMVKTRFDNEIRKPGWKFWEHARIEMNSRDRAVKLHNKWKEWTDGTIALTADVHSTHRLRNRRLGGLHEGAV